MNKKVPPPRLRETIRREQERSRRSGRYLMIGVILAAAGIVGLLGYGLIERNVLRPHVDATVEQADMYVKAGEHIQINVVNACGADGMAQKFTEFLRARRFDVPEYGTSQILEPHSKVIDRIGDSISAQKVAYALGIPMGQIETDIDSTLYLRATVIIGGDYMTLRPMQ